MTSPDFRKFVDTLADDHQTWLSGHSSPSGGEFFDHYVGDETHPTGLLRVCEAWRSEHGYTRVRPPHGDVVRIGREVFRGAVADDLAVEIFNNEPEEHQRTCHYRRQVKGDPKK
jgi:hypothetical protein